MKWALGVAASIITAVIVAFIFGGIDARQNIAVMRTELTAVKYAVDSLNTELNSRPRYDAHQALAKEQSQAITDSAQNKLLDILKTSHDAMDSKQTRFDERLIALERKVGQ